MNSPRDRIEVLQRSHRATQRALHSYPDPSHEQAQNLRDVLVRGARRISELQKEAGDD